MKKLFFASIAILLLAAGCGSSQTSSPSGQAPMQPTANQSSQGQASVNPISTNVGAVAGVDLSEFGTQANQSSSLTSQDGSSDIQTMSADGATINSQTDSVSNPIQ